MGAARCDSHMEWDPPNGVVVNQLAYRRCDESNMVEHNYKGPRVFTAGQKIERYGNVNKTTARKNRNNRARARPRE